MGNELFTSTLVSANKAYQLGKTRLAMQLFQKALTENPQSLPARAGLSICHTRFLAFDAAWELVMDIDESEYTNLDEITLFRVIYSKARVLHSQKKIADGYRLIDTWISRIPPMYRPILLLEKAAFLELENKNDEALEIIQTTNETLNRELRPQTIGRMIYLLTAINQRKLAVALAKENFLSGPTLPRAISLFTLGILGHPFYLTLLTSYWLIVWFLIPNAPLSVAVLLFFVFVLGILPLITFARNQKSIRNYLLFFWISTIAMFLLKTVDIYLQIGILCSFIIVHLAQLIFYKSFYAKYQ